MMSYRKGLRVSFYAKKMLFYYLLGPLNLLLRRKSSFDNYWGRCREIMADPVNIRIPRVSDAGKCVDDYLIMHNGLKVKMGEFSYSGDFGKIILSMNKGVHEPQEEFLFSEILKYMPQGAVMLELGSYWAFYSMWFNSKVHRSRCWMIEPDEHCRRCGEENFRLNGLSGTFIAGKVGRDGINIDNFLFENKIQELHLLHADVQGAEYDMLVSCLKSLEEQKIWYLFISTHSQELHYACMDLLKQKNYVIVASADFMFGTFCFDGIVLAKLKNAPGPSWIELPLRRPNRRPTSKRFLFALSNLSGLLMEILKKRSDSWTRDHNSIDSDSHPNGFIVPVLTIENESPSQEGIIRNETIN